MKKIALLFVTLLLVSCGTGSIKDKSKMPLYEILTQQSNGGANIQFYEILTEAKEIKMLLNDKNLKHKVKENDTASSNFVILNMGEKNSGGYAFKIENVEETNDKIIIQVKIISPEKSAVVTDVMTTPYCILKINSKQEIVFK